MPTFWNLCQVHLQRLDEESAIAAAENFIQPLKISLTEGSETSAKQPDAWKYPKENIQIQNTAKM
jgi:hypothetical protein